MTVRAVRGATQLDRDERDHLLERVGELVREVVAANSLTNEDIISILFTATPDLHAEFPAFAARAAGITGVPLMCAVEIDVAGALPRTVRLMAHVETDRSRDEIVHVYQYGARVLRPGIAVPGGPAAGGVTA